MMEVESVSHRRQTVPLSARSTSPKEPTIAVQLSLALQQVPHFHSRQQYTPYTERQRRRLMLKISGHQEHVFTMARQQLSRLGACVQEVTPT